MEDCPSSESISSTDEIQFGQTIDELFESIDLPKSPPILLATPPERNDEEKSIHAVIGIKHEPEIKNPQPNPDQFAIEIANLRIRSNSPYKNNSNSNSDTSDHEYSAASSIQSNTKQKVKKYKRLTYNDVANSLSHYYDDCNKYSNEIDILISYVRAQKHMFILAAYITTVKLYTLISLAIMITASITIITPFVHDYTWSTILISSCNATAATIISITNYFKLESTANAYSFIANSYERFENSLELTNNRLLFMQNDIEQSDIVLDKIKETEFKIGEVRDISQVLLPHELKNLFPIMIHINIFSFIKKMESHKRTLIVKFKDIKNELSYRMFHLNNNSVSQSVYDLDVDQEKQRILFLNNIKEKIKNDLLNYKDEYNQLDYLFTKEIQFAESHINVIGCMGIYTCLFSKPRHLQIDQYTNPVIIDYLNVLFDQ